MFDYCVAMHMYIYTNSAVSLIGSFAGGDQDGDIGILVATHGCPDFDAIKKSYHGGFKRSNRFQETTIDRYIHNGMFMTQITNGLGELDRIINASNNVGAQNDIVISRHIAAPWQWENRNGRYTILRSSRVSNRSQSCSVAGVVG